MSCFSKKQIEEINNLITEKIVVFYDGLIERGQISNPPIQYLLVKGKKKQKVKLRIIK